MRKHYVFPKNYQEEWYSFTFLQTSLMFGLIEDSWIVSVSTFNLLQNIVLVELYKENPASFSM